MENKEMLLNSLEVTNRLKEYWENVFHSPKVENISLVNGYEGKGEYELRKSQFKIPQELLGKLDKLINGDDLALYTIFLSILSIQIAKYTSMYNFMIGIPSFYEPKSEFKDNKVLAIRSDIKTNMTIKEILIYTKSSLIETYKNQIYPLNNILEKSGVKDLRSILPINIVMKNLHHDEDIDYSATRF